MARPQLTIDMSGVGFCGSVGINGLVKLRNGCFSRWQFKIITVATCP
jgi:hypothetical protein